MTRITLSDRTAIEAGIYARQSLTEIAAKIGKTTIAVSREIRKNCTQVRSIHPHGNDVSVKSTLVKELPDTN